MIDSHLHVKDVITKPVHHTTMVAGKEKLLATDNMIVVYAEGLPDPETGELFENLTDPETGEKLGPHAIYIPIEAVASRMHAYGLDTPQEGIEAILKEHAVRLHDLEIKEHGAAYPKYNSMGGLSNEVKITWANETKSKRDKVLKTHASRIKSEYGVEK